MTTISCVDVYISVAFFKEQSSNGRNLLQTRREDYAILEAGTCTSYTTDNKTVNELQHFVVEDPPQLPNEGQIKSTIQQLKAALASSQAEDEEL